MTIQPELIQKYNSPAPRYTSYPTVPLWENNIQPNHWSQLVDQAFQIYGKEEGISLYIHLPFCESLCTYCGCNKRITKNHDVENPYLESLLKEWENYLNIFHEKPKLAAIHLGGGTPTFFSAENLFTFLKKLIESCEILPGKEFSFEGHPNNTSIEHLKKLAELGFDRVSFGIQDFDLLVQKTINRIQPFERVQEAVENARSVGFKSINFDLIYGLPYQNEETLSCTFKAVQELKPDRIAFYSYAHVPTSFPAQRSYESHLPNEIEKRSLYELGKRLLIEMGYTEIGMDHFALPKDPLNLARQSGKLHRNFMGYTTSKSKILIGLGASSISDIYIAYAQNQKSVELYQNEISKAIWAIVKGHSLTEEDLLVKEIILDLICKKAAFVPVNIWSQLSDSSLENLRDMEIEGMINIMGKTIQITELGIAFIRIICMQFDLRLQHRQEEVFSFSKAI